MNLLGPGDLLTQTEAAVQFGGKAANLLALSRAGLPVPAWRALAADAFRERLRSDPASAATLAGCLQELRATPSQAAAVAAKARALILGLQLQPGLTAELRRAVTTSFANGAPLAVRSSALGEDAADCSFAGMHDSILYVRGNTAVADAVRQVWASAFNERALCYRLQHKLPLEDIAIGVVIQEMVDASVSGVMFTQNPTSGNVLEITISSLFGAGEGLVSGALDADTFLVSKKTLAVQATVIDKPEMLVAATDNSCGLRKVPVPETRRREPSLSATQLQAVATCGMTVEQLYGRPQDIEFCLAASGDLHLLQARPITTAVEYGPAAGQPLIWDNSNIVESYAGVTTPMTFSFIRRAYTIVYHCFAEVMGISPRVVHRNRVVFENMLGLFRGQVYYNLLNWYRLIRLFPGFQYNKPFMESMMGLKEPAELKDEAVPVSALRRYAVELPALVRLVVRTLWNFARIRRLTARFQENFDSHYSRWSALDFTKLPPHELMKLYREMEDALLWNWRAPIINDFFVMIFYGTLKKLCVTWCDDHAGSLQNDLICGEGGIESTEPPKMLLRLAALAAKTPELRKLIVEQPAETLVETIPGDARFAEFNGLLGEYLHRYGFRCMNELKLEEYSLRDRPQFVYTILRNYLVMDRPEALDIAAIAKREGEIRRGAETKAFAALKLQGGWLPKGPIFRWVLGGARLGVKNRENMRFARTKIYGLLRELLRGAGHHFQAEGILRDREDIFYLTIDEVWDYVKGTAVTTDLQALADLRRAEFARWRSTETPPPADHFETFGMAYHRNLLRNWTGVTHAAADGHLRGIGCCPGKLCKAVKVLRTPADDLRLNGEILVAERTDPGWVPLYPSVSGLLIERGSILSHSAIVAREMGIPTIVGIPGLIATLHTGQVVEMDGAAGTVRVVPEGASGTPGTG